VQRGNRGLDLVRPGAAQPQRAVQGGAPGVQPDGSASFLRKSL
jgi:hypothetical protein